MRIRIIPTASGNHVVQVVSKRYGIHKVTNAKTGESAYIETTIENPRVKEKIDFLKSLGH